ncbi:MAG TPA: multicopper oxidase domain-containing protein [Stellaceae bacterium]|jgi:spore coat protein A|nr:multicopper oxidase domain-containing protein [Stellaceae bacterium]
MQIDRRKLLLGGGALVAAQALEFAPPVAAQEEQEMSHSASMPVPAPPSTPEILDPQKLARFVDRLPIPPVARPAGRRADPKDAHRTLAYYRLSMRQIKQRLHRDLPPTRVWSYGDSIPGPTLETRAGEPLLIEWVNELPTSHFLPIDHTLHGAETTVPDVRTVAHVHGARVPPESDGYPDNWFTHGHSALYRYPNQQEAALLWYHDHAMGIERLNQYAGLFGLFVIRDEQEDRLTLPKGPYEIPLVICDRQLTTDGRLYYPTSGDPKSPWVPEVYGDTILVNGKLFPFAEVEPRLYRLRVVNASNARFLNLAFSDGRPFHVIGADQGLLPAPEEVPFLSVAPAERADLLVDFAPLAGGEVRLMSQTYELAQFRVRAGAAPASDHLPKTLRPVTRIPEASAIKTRTLSLDENMEAGAAGRMLMLLNGARWHEPITETPVLNSVEIWNLVNLTEDIHPIHLHLVRFQVLDRQYFDVGLYQRTGTLRTFGTVFAGESGWKDTVQAHAGMVTRIIIRFEGFTGRYVWHCHVLEHAAREMMRPFEIVSAAGVSASSTTHSATMMAHKPQPE